MSSYDPFDRRDSQVVQLRRTWEESRRYLLPALGVVLVVVGLWSSYYQVPTGQVGAVVRLGEFIGTTEPGLRFKLPFGIDRVVKVPVERQLKMEFGFRTARADVRSQYVRNRGTMAEAKMLTGDLNVGTVEWIIQYEIQEPYKYLFKFRNLDSCAPRQAGCRPTLRLMAEATMRTVVGDYSIDELITGGREEIEVEAKRQLQDLNKRYDTGINIQQLKLQDVNVPDVVKPALREVEEAKQERESVINQARTQKEAARRQAEGRAQEMLEVAQGYASKRTNEAEGDATRFRQLYTEYRKAPEVTRTRLYLEALNDVLPKAQRKILVDSKTKGLVPLLNIPGDKP